MNQTILRKYQERFCFLSDDELDLELIRLTNDSYLCRSDEELNNVHYYERHEAIWSELRNRGMVSQIST